VSSTRSVSASSWGVGGPHQRQQVAARAPLGDPGGLDQRVGVRVGGGGGGGCCGRTHVGPDPEQRVRDPAQQEDPLPPTARRLAAGPCRGPDCCCCCCDWPTTVSFSGPGSCAGGSSGRSAAVNSIRVRSGSSTSVAWRGGLITQASLEAPPG